MADDITARLRAVSLLCAAHERDAAVLYAATSGGGAVLVIHDAQLLKLVKELMSFGLDEAEELDEDDIVLIQPAEPIEA